MLSGGELGEKYAKDFVIVEGTYPSKYPEGHELRKIAKSGMGVPLFVFLDNNGNEVLRTYGFTNKYEGALVHKFVAERRYSEMTYQQFLKQNPY
jgi:thioredoxin-related protein